MRRRIWERGGRGEEREEEEIRGEEVHFIANVVELVHCILVN